MGRLAVPLRRGHMVGDGLLVLLRFAGPVWVAVVAAALYVVRAVHFVNDGLIAWADLQHFWEVFLVVLRGIYMY